MSNMNRFCAVLGALLCVSPVFAQNTNSGDIRGTVTDATGAIIAGATVNVEDVDKHVTTTYVTNGVGLYDTGSIVPDHYILTFTKDGFDSFKRGPVTLQVETLTVNGILKVGSASETVQVSTDVPLLDTESGAQSTDFSEIELQDLPNFASWENFIILMPGTSGTPTGGLSNVNPGQEASVNGNASFYNVLGDGITMSLPSNGNSADYNFDTLAEVQVVTNGFTAQYENGGVIYNQISKGGSSQYHGDLFEYFQNNALDAAPYSFGNQATVPTLRANYFGGSVGGYVPWKPLKNKLFFFFNYDYSQDYGGSSNLTTSVPTAAMLSGDFTGQPTIYDPTTQTLANGKLTRQSFASEYSNGNKIPSSMIDPVAQAIAAYYPKPNTAGTTVNGITTNNYFVNLPANSPAHALFWRADYDITPKNRLTVTDFQYWGTGENLGIGICPIGCNTTDNSEVTAQASDVWTFSPDKINEFRFGLSTQNNVYIPGTLNQGYPAKLGLQFAKANLFPEVNVTGACCTELDPGINAIQHQLMFEPSDVVTMIKGKHVLHFGGELLAQQLNATNWGNVDAGSTAFTGVYTNSTQGDTTTGQPYADFLLGQAQSWSAANTPEYYPRYKTVQAFAQDDLKLRPNLTINAGLRWEGWTSISEKTGNELLFDPTIVNPATNPLGVANTLGAMWYGSTHTNGRMQEQAPIWDLFLPRVGFSWQLRPNTVLRGGFGLYAYNFQLSVNTRGQGAAFASTGNETDQTNGVNPVVLLDSSGNVNYQGNSGAGINSLYQNSPTTPDAYNGQSVNFVNFNTPAQKIEQYNLEVQRDLGHNLAVDVAYVGSHAFDQAFSVDMNQIPEGELGPNDTVGATNVRPYPNYQAITGERWVGISNYNALQATVQKRMSYGLQFNFNYTWSKFLNEDDPCAFNCGASTVQNTYDPSANYGPADYDIRSMFKGRIVYALPVGRGGGFFNRNPVLAETLGGWQTSATIIAQSGNPFTPLMQTNTDYSQAGDLYPNPVSSISPTSGPHGTTQEWFNVNAFAPPPPGTYGTVGRDSLRGPGLSDVNFSLGKNFSIWRESKLQIRIDTTNVLNHPSFGLPDNYIGPGHNAQITSVTVGGRAVELLGKISF
jgi:hypothetical protein